MKPLIFTGEATGKFGTGLSGALDCEIGLLSVHRYPDDESCPRFITPVAGRDVIFAWALDHPDHKLLLLYLVARLARELGARSIGFVIPYLPYLRQQWQRHEGEGQTSRYVAQLISGCCDWLVTVESPVHEFRYLSEIYGVPTCVVPAAPAMAKWIAANVQQPVIFGAGEESESWIAEIAAETDCPYLALPNKKSDDASIDVRIPDASFWLGMTPVLVDGIVSTARTMAAAVVQIDIAGMAPPVCVIAHPLFAGDGYQALQASRVARIVSCCTIAHPTNRIDLSDAIGAAIEKILAETRTQTSLLV